MSRLREYLGDMDKSLVAVTEMLKEHFGEMDRVGGERRIYEVEGEGKHGVIFVIRNTLAGIGLCWRQPDRIETIHYWNPTFNPLASPDYALDLPPEGDVSRMMPAIIQALEHQRMGQIEV